MWYKMFLNPTVLKILGVLIIVVSSIVYVKYTQNQIDTLTQDNELLQLEIEEQHRVIDSLQNDIQSIIESRDKLSELLIKSNNEITELKEKLYRENQGKQSLEQLAIKKPQLVENIVNKATKDVFDCFESLIDNQECN